MSKRFYVTTPIYYANGLPHIGHAYTSLIADLLARYKRMLGYEVKFATGTDENGQKMVQKAKAEGKEVMDFLDQIATGHQRVRDEMRISYTDFIRTSSPKHKSFVQEVLQKTYDAGDIYQGAYKGLYCVGCESFKKPSDLIEHDGKQVCPDHLTEPDQIEEQNRFFALSNYQEALLELYAHQPTFCVPDFRFNEVRRFVEQGLEDFSISREGSDFGISLPFDDGSVTYIWFDALFNYLTVCQGGDEAFRDEGEVVHILGKDIARFHAIYRPAMLMSTGHKLPNKEVINGYFTIDGQKMSKSLGNVIEPTEMVAKHGRDALVYYLFSDIKIGNDGDFSRERFHATRDNVLLKGRGNLVSRVVKLAQKNELYEIAIETDDLQQLFAIAQQEGLEHNDLRKLFTHGYEGAVIDAYLHSYDLVDLLRDRYHIVQLANKYVDTTKPRETTTSAPEQARRDLSVLVWLIKGLGLLSSPFLLEGFARLQEIVQLQDTAWEQFGTEESSEELGRLLDLRSFGVSYQPGHLY